MKILSDKWRSTFAEEQVELVKELVAGMAEAVMIVDAQEGNTDPPILHINKAFTELTGYALDDIVGKTPKILQGPRTERTVLERLKREVTAKEEFRGRTWNYRKDGSAFMMEWEIVSFHDTQGETSFYMTIQREAKDTSEPTPK